ncbi:MAG: hypothetical protein K6F69_02515 [Treponema sp.]|nr:hypothetical protein [Treponema sp.]
MDELYKLILKKTEEKNNIMEELEKKSQYAKNAIEEIYSGREKKLKLDQQKILSLLEDGDFETAMQCINESNDILNENANEKIKEKIEDYNLRNCKID